MKSLLFLLLFLSLLACDAPSQETQTVETGLPGQDSLAIKRPSFPEPIGYVNDFDSIFTAEQIQTLDSLLADFEQRTTNEMAIVSVSSIEPYKDLGEYAKDLFNEWGIGQADRDNGLLFIFSPSLRQARITTGYGTEKILSDELCAEVLNEEVAPLFKEDRYYEGTKQGLLELMERWEATEE